MLIPEHKYLVEEVSGAQTTANGKHKFITVILCKPGYTDEFGEKVGKDDLFECKAWNKTADAMPVLKKGDKVEAQLAIAGTKHLDQNNGQEFYYCNVTLRQIKVL
jgi:hypothetical protein